MHGPGAGVAPQPLSALSFRLDLPSIFKEALANDLFLGRLSRSKVDMAFRRELGSPAPSRVIAAVVRVGAKPVAIAVGDCEDERMQRDAFAPLLQAADKASAALFLLILRARTGLSEQ